MVEVTIFVRKRCELEPEVIHFVHCAASRLAHEVGESIFFMSVELLSFVECRLKLTIAIGFIAKGLREFLRHWQ